MCVYDLTLGTNPLSDVHIVNIFSSVFLAFSFSYEQKILILLSPLYQFFFFYGWSFCVLLKNFFLPQDCKDILLCFPSTGFSLSVYV